MGRGKIEETEQRTRYAIEQLCEKGDTEREQDDREWTEHHSRQMQTGDEARHEFGIPEPQAQERKDPERDGAEAEQAHMRRARGRPVSRRPLHHRHGRDGRENEQIAFHYGPEIEQEIQRRAAEIQWSESESHHPLESDSYAPAIRASHPPEDDMDFEIGD